MTGEVNIDVLPQRIGCQFDMDEVLQLFMQIGHELSSWKRRSRGTDRERVRSRHTGGNGVRVEMVHCYFFEVLLGFRGDRFQFLRSILTGTKASRSLLVHFRSWCNAIDSHEKDFLGFDHAKQELQVRQTDMNDGECLECHAELTSR